MASGPRDHRPTVVIPWHVKILREYTRRVCNWGTKSMPRQARHGMGGGNSNNDDDGQPATLVFVVKDEEKRVDVN